MKKMSFNKKTINGIEKKSSPHNSDRHGWKPDIICCHQTSGRISSCINWFLDPESKVSSHYAVSKEGKIYQFTELDRAAWCNGTRYKTEDVKYTNHYSNALTRLVKERRTNANFYTVSIEFENADTGVLTDKQYKAGFELMKYIIITCRKLYGVEFPPDREHIIGHYECSPVNKAACPGLDFPFSRFVADLQVADGRPVTVIPEEEDEIPVPVAEAENLSPLSPRLNRKKTAVRK